MLSLGAWVVVLAYLVVRGVADCVRWESECGCALRGRDFLYGPLPAGVVVASLDHSWTVLRSCQWCLSTGGPYEGGVLYFSRSAGFLCAVFDGQ